MLVCYGCECIEASMNMTFESARYSKELEFPSSIIATFQKFRAFFFAHSINWRTTIQCS